MANTEILQTLKVKADQADQVLANLRAQLDQLKKDAVTEACCKEETRLAAENIQLKQEVNRLKQQLVAAETQNGVVQVPLPSSVMRAKSTPTGSEAAPAQQSVQKPLSQPPQGAADNKQQQKKKEKPKKEAKPAAPPAASQPVDVSRLNMRVGYINSAQKHPDADGLYVEEVDLGEEKPRTIVSGLVKFVPLEQMQQRYAIFACNLKPAKMRGIMSQGMIMCASTPEKVEIIVPPEGVVKGDRIIVDGYPGEPDELLNPKKKIWEQIQPDLRVNAEGAATYKGGLWRVHEKGTCTAPTMRDSPIK